MDRALRPIDALRIAARQHELRLGEIGLRRCRHLPRLHGEIPEEIELALVSRLVQQVGKVRQRIRHRRQLRLELHERGGECPLVPLHGIVVLEETVQGILARTVFILARAETAVADDRLTRRRIEEMRHHVQDGIRLQLRERARRARLLRPLADKLNIGRVRQRPVVELTLDRSQHALLASAVTAPPPRDASEQLRQRRMGKLVGEEFGGDILKVVRLVEDEATVGGQDVAAGTRGLRQHQRVVCHDQMRTQRPLARLADEALRREGAAPAAAILAGADETTAQERHIDGIEIAVTRLGVEPRHKGTELLAFVPVHRVVAVTHQLAERMQTKVIAASLQHGDTHLVGDSLDCARDVVRDQLALEVARRRGDDNGRIVQHSPVHRRHEIGERLPYARARLNHQMFASVEGARHRLEHVDLPRPWLISFHQPQRAAGLKMRRHILDVKR